MASQRRRTTPAVQAAQRARKSAPRMSAPRKWSALDYMQRFRSYGTLFLPGLLAGIALRIAEMLADLATPWPIAIVVDSVIGRRPLNAPAAIVLGPFSASPVALLTAAVMASIFLVAVSGLFDY